MKKLIILILTLVLIFTLSACGSNNNQSSQDGDKQSAQNTTAALSPTAGVITSTAGTSRQIQLGLKLLF